MHVSTDLIGAVLLEANDDWQLEHRYMQIEGMAELNLGPGDDQLLEATPRADGHLKSHPNFHHLDERDRDEPQRAFLRVAFTE